MNDQEKREAEVRNKRPVLVHGSAGGVFNIDGPGLGSSGTLTIGGKVITPKRWEDRTIRGLLPDDVSGEVVLTTETGVRKGTFPYSPPQPAASQPAAPTQPPPAQPPKNTETPKQGG